VQVSDFKTSAWQSKEGAETYHASTVAAHRLFQFVRHDLYLRYLQRYAPRGAKILDVGCGTGLISVPLHDLGYQVVACDASQAMLNRASESFGSRAIELRLGNGFNLPAYDGEFDVVISRMFIAHFPDWAKVLREKARATRPGGIVFFDFGNREHLLSADQSPERNKEFPYGTDVNTPATFYAVASEKEMSAAASECGLDVVNIIPHGLLLYNLDFWQAVGRQRVDEFNAKLDELLQDQKARDLLFLIEESFVSYMPKQTTYGNLVVLRRNSAA
jgi:ubiquinone/menaquinone biosynthesis C-methylase UbiE